jgi:transposase
MPRTGRPKAVLELTDTEREQLVRWERRRKSSQALTLRSRIVLKCATGLSNTEVAQAVGVTPSTVGKWRSRFCELRLDGLVDDPRPGRPATISTEQVEEVLVATLESTPPNATHWTRASMAKRSGLSKSTIGRIWRTFELGPPPHRHVPRRRSLPSSADFSEELTAQNTSFPARLAHAVCRALGYSAFPLVLIPDVRFVACWFHESHGRSV